MEQNNYQKFAYVALNIIINDIMEMHMLTPKLVFDYCSNPEINTGYYMYQNPAGDIITINMHSIYSLKNDNDIKTVTVYGFIHEIMHMYQVMSSMYKTNKDFYTRIEDVADRNTIDYIRNNLSLINTRLNFEFNEIFLKGIERQLNCEANYRIDFYNFKQYAIKTIVGAMCNKLNINFDYLSNILRSYDVLNVVFPDGRNIFIDLEYGEIPDLNILINQIYLTDFKFIRPRKNKIGNHEMIDFYLY